MVVAARGLQTASPGHLLTTAVVEEVEVPVAPAMPSRVGTEGHLLAEREVPVATTLEAQPSTVRLAPNQEAVGAAEEFVSPLFTELGVPAEQGALW